MLIINTFEEGAVLSFIREQRRTFSFCNPILIEQVWSRYTNRSLKRPVGYDVQLVWLHDEL